MNNDILRKLRLSKKHQMTFSEIQEISIDAAHEIERLRAENARMKNAISKLNVAILDKGKKPKHHDRVMILHRREWPTLWKRIDSVLQSAE